MQIIEILLLSILIFEILRLIRSAWMGSSWNIKIASEKIAIITDESFSRITKEEEEGEEKEGVDERNIYIKYININDKEIETEQSRTEF